MKHENIAFLCLNTRCTLAHTRPNTRKSTRVGLEKLMVFTQMRLINEKAGKKINIYPRPPGSEGNDPNQMDKRKSGNKYTLTQDQPLIFLSDRRIGIMEIGKK